MAVQGAGLSLDGEAAAADRFLSFPFQQQLAGFWSGEERPWGPSRNGNSPTATTTTVLAEPGFPHRHYPQLWVSGIGMTLRLPLPLEQPAPVAKGDASPVPGPGGIIREGEGENEPKCPGLWGSSDIILYCIPSASALVSGLWAIWFQGQSILILIDQHFLRDSCFIKNSWSDGCCITIL